MLFHKTQYVARHIKNKLNYYLIVYFNMTYEQMIKKIIMFLSALIKYNV